MIRIATAKDLDEIVSLAYRFHAKSPTYSKLTPDEFAFRKMVLTMLMLKSSVVLVYGSPVKGFLLGSIEKAWFREPIAQDIMTVAESGGAWLLRAFVRWAKAKGAGVILLGQTNGESERAQKMYETFSTKVGSVYEVKL